MSDAPETKTEPATNAPGETVASTTAETAEQKSTTEEPVTKTTDSVFSMFGGGPKKEKKEEEGAEADVNEPSGSAKAQREKAQEDEVRAPSGIEVYVIFFFSAM